MRCSEASLGTRGLRVPSSARLNIARSVRRSSDLSVNRADPCAERPADAVRVVPDHAWVARLGRAREWLTETLWIAPALGLLLAMGLAVATLEHRRRCRGRHERRRRLRWRRRLGAGDPQHDRGLDADLPGAGLHADGGRPAARQRLLAAAAADVSGRALEQGRPDVVRRDLHLRDAGAARGLARERPGALGHGRDRARDRLAARLRLLRQLDRAVAAGSQHRRHRRHHDPGRDRGNVRRSRRRRGGGVRARARLGGDRGLRRGSHPHLGRRARRDHGDRLPRDPRPRRAQ